MKDYQEEFMKLVNNETTWNKMEEPEIHCWMENILEDFDSFAEKNDHDTKAMLKKIMATQDEWEELYKDQLEYIYEPHL